MKKKEKVVEMYEFKQALENILNLLCYAYYVRYDNLVSDQVFDELEKLYTKITGKLAPMRSIESDKSYSNKTKMLYNMINKRIK